MDCNKAGSSCGKPPWPEPPKAANGLAAVAAPAPAPGIKAANGLTAGVAVAVEAGVLVGCGVEESGVELEAVASPGAGKELAAWAPPIPPPNILCICLICLII
ncbi:hypothetical protein WICPIJ_008537 [Wickerhamomyces pijperi]|uniref:Uncharacterized protein n=1 Tax=Wickerhamomyces pijperi TaxID=599730 RepID=A0A9P8PYU5_WICPI|nr:hypothetical protein WICPIJ_008537 [Wickerhamomyces pijperi]